MRGGFQRLPWRPRTFLSGIVHWAFDTFWDEDTFLIGPWVIAPFRNHHRDPLAMTRHAFLDRTSGNALCALPIALIGLLHPLHVVAAFGALVCSVAVLLTNQLHAWSHMPRVPRVVRWLQRSRIVLSPDAHANHHVSGTAHYSVTTGWTNAILDTILTITRVRRGRT